MPDAALFPKAGSPAHHATLRPQLFSAYLPSPSPTALPCLLTLPLAHSSSCLLTPPTLAHSSSPPTYPSNPLPQFFPANFPLHPSPTALPCQLPPPTLACSFTSFLPSKHRKAPGSSPEASPNLLFQIQPTGHREPNTAAYPMPAMPGLFAHF